MTTIPQILKDCRAQMDKAIESSKREFLGIRSGKASPSMLDTVRVELYGTQMSLNQVAGVSAPEPRVIIVTPFDKGQIKNAMFSAYRVPRFRDTPQLETVLVNRPDLAPIGAGETPIIAIAPAVAAAIFQATGIRPRRAAA